MKELVYWLNKMTDKKYYLIGVIVTILFISISLVYGFKKPADEGIAVDDRLAPANNMLEEVDDVENNLPTEETREVMIELKGQVQRPGVYEVDEGSRLVDAVRLAGGLTDIADDRSINMALKLVDQMMIYVPFVGEEGVEQTEIGMASEETNQKININSADIQLLTELSGIGNARAQSIVAYREENGRFKEIEEIKNISGIGDKIFESIKDEIMVD